MNRKLHTTVPMISSKLKPSIPDYTNIQLKEEVYQKQQIENHDQRRKATEKTELKTGCG